jgi:hypothetical protein
MDGGLRLDLTILNALRLSRASAYVAHKMIRYLVSDFDVEKRKDKEKVRSSKAAPARVGSIRA